MSPSLATHLENVKFPSDAYPRTEFASTADPAGGGCVRSSSETYLATQTNSQLDHPGHNAPV